MAATAPLTPTRPAEPQPSISSPRAGEALATTAYTYKLSLWDKVAKGQVALVSARWLVQLYKDKGILPCRQELPPEALARLPTKPEEECIVSLSYPWLTPQHPDPKGFHLSKVAPVLALYMRLHKLADVSVFWDWASCFQNYYKGTAAPPEEYAEGMERVKRTPDEEEKFKVHWTPSTIGTRTCTPRC